MYLLSKSGYGKALKPLRDATINTLFARSVVEGMVDGKVYVDDLENPSTFYILHPYGMSLLLGSPGNEAFNKDFLRHALNAEGTRKRPEWMQAYPNDWDDVLRNFFKGHLVRASENLGGGIASAIELNTRVNFRFDRKKYAASRRPMTAPGTVIRRTGTEAFQEMKGSVVPRFFWNGVDEFLRNGAGFSLYADGALASTAYSSYVLDDKLELGIETVEGFRRRGYAYHVCAALIEHCLAEGYESVWSCRLENVGSYNLAQRLGFVPTLELPYYRLCG